MNKLSYIITFAAGAGSGFFAANLLLKKKYEKIVQEEIESVKQAYKNESKSNEDSDKKADEEVEETVEDDYPEEDLEDEEDAFDYELSPEEKDEYDDLLTEYGEPVHQSYNNRPYVISPADFDELDGYTTEGMSYYVDGILADETGHIVDIEETIGHKNLAYMGEYEEDVLHVRNPITKTDYEIFLDPRKFSEVYPGRN